MIKINNTSYEQLALERGFSAAATVSGGLLHCEEKIRAFCSPDKCANFGTSWICPPGCGELKDCQNTVDSYENALLLQNIYENVDTSSTEQMTSLSVEHNKRVAELARELRRELPKLFVLTTGGCDLCESCTFPKEPCRVPDKRRGSLSAFGIDVSKLCAAAEMEYSFAAGTLRFIACILY